MLQVKNLHKELLPLFTIVFLLPLLVSGIGVLISTITSKIYKFMRNDKDFTQFERKWEKKRLERSKLKKIFIEKSITFLFL
ncbi:MAG: hypothetical protein ACFFAO_02615 [Candidatus Hermodarchaeota archaeon]